MKSKLVALLFVASILPAAATFTLSTQFGTALTSGSAPVPDGTLWALVVDADNNSTFAGGFGLNSSIFQAGTVAANAAFVAGQSLSLGTNLGGDIVFAMGGFNGTGDLGLGNLTAVLPGLNLGDNGLATNRNYAFYWFPGATYAPGTNTIGSQVGGINNAQNVALAGIDAMIIPADAAFVNQGAVEATEWSGVNTAAQFTAVNLIPEPSAALLGALGALGLLRRRRI